MSTLEAKETSRLISADKVEGTAVHKPAGEKIGKIENIMIDKLSGKVAYAVMSFGGFLGIGDKHYPLPWNMLKYDTRLGGYVVNLDKKVLEGARSYGPTVTPVARECDYQRERVVYRPVQSDNCRPHSLRTIADDEHPAPGEAQNRDGEVGHLDGASNTLSEPRSQFFHLIGWDFSEVESRSTWVKR